MLYLAMYIEYTLMSNSDYGNTIANSKAITWKYAYPKIMAFRLRSLFWLAIFLLLVPSTLNKGELKYCTKYRSHSLSFLLFNISKMLNSKLFVRKRATKSKFILKKSSLTWHPNFCACISMLVCSRPCLTNIFQLFRRRSGEFFIWAKQLYYCSLSFPFLRQKGFNVQFP